jgi:hypothetical protein
MQYLLSEEEFKKLCRAAPDLAFEKDRVIADLCRRVCNLEAGKRKPGCIRGSDEYEGYCDDCSVRDICTFPHKQWSK